MDFPPNISLGWLSWADGWSVNLIATKVTCRKRKRVRRFTGHVSASWNRWTRLPNTSSAEVKAIYIVKKISLISPKPVGLPSEVTSNVSMILNTKFLTGGISDQPFYEVLQCCTSNGSICRGLFQGGARGPLESAHYPPWRKKPMKTMIDSESLSYWQLGRYASPVIENYIDLVSSNDITVPAARINIHAAFTRHQW